MVATTPCCVPPPPPTRMWLCCEQDKAGFTPLMRLLSLPPSRTSREDQGEAAQQRAAAALQLLARPDLDWAVGA